MNIKLPLIAAALVLVPASAFADDDGDGSNVSTKPAVVHAAPANGGYVAPQWVAYQGGNIPDGSSIEKRPNLGLIGAGLGVFGAAYVPSVITAIAACGPQTACTATAGAGWLYLPIVGPFVTAAMATSDGGRALAAFDGGLQLTGAAIAVAGLLAQKKFVVWQDRTASVSLTPGAGSAQAGLTLTVTHM